VPRSFNASAVLIVEPGGVPMSSIVPSVQRKPCTWNPPGTATVVLPTTSPLLLIASAVLLPTPPARSPRLSIVQRAGGSACDTAATIEKIASSQRARPIPFMGGSNCGT
jgi:hypothetical protein